MNHIHGVLDQHLEDAALLWLRRDAAVVQPHFTLEDLALLDNQLEAHLDGLRIAEVNQAGTAWELCKRELEWEEPGEKFVAATIAIESPGTHRLDSLLKLSGNRSEESRPFISAIAWQPYDAVRDPIEHFLDSGDPRQQFLGIAACSLHREKINIHLARALEDTDSCLRARSLRAVGELGMTELLPTVRNHLAEADETSRFNAAWSASRLAADDESIAVLRQSIQDRSRHTDFALQILPGVLNATHTDSWFNLLMADEATTRWGVVSCGLIGQAQFIPTLLERMQEPRLARIAGEAFSMITGVDLAYEDLEGEWPEGFEAGPNDDPADENVEMDPDENLPWPDVQKVKNWWMKHRHQFEPGVRYLCGRPMTEDWLEHVLRYGYQRQRAAAALELAIRRPGTPLFNVKAPGYRQKRLLGLK